jgi:hypothetical protein
MKFQIGDKIVILHSGEEGEIVDEINKEMVLVEVNGVSFPVYRDQIDHPYFKRFTDKKKEAPTKHKKFIEDLKKEKISLERYKVGEGVWLSFLPVFDKDVFDDDVVEYFKIYMVNQTTVAYHFHYKYVVAGNTVFELKNELGALTDFYIHDVALEDLNDAPRFEAEFTLKEPDKKKASHVETSVKIKPKQLFQRIAELLRKQEASFSYPLFETYPDKVVEDDFKLDKLSYAGYKVIDAKKFMHHLEPPRTVVDLHIEKLSDHHQQLTNGEKLELQLKTFEKYYELSILHHQPTLIVVHGLGSGKLRDEIHDKLRLKKEVKSFVNQYHPSFGYGATEIYFQY